MKKALFLVSVFPIVFLAACSGPKCDPVWTISGSLDDYPESKVYIDLVKPSGFQVIDSTETDKSGGFSFMLPCKEDFTQEPNHLYTIRLSNNQSLLFDPVKDKLTVKANAGQLNAGSVTGNEATASLQSFNKHRNELRGEFGLETRVLSGLSRENDPEGWKAQEAKADFAMNAYREYVRGYADTVKFPELAWYAAANLNPVGDFYYLQQFVERRKAAGEKSAFLDFLENDIAEKGKDFLRFKADDFITKDAQGDSIKLSSREGKVTYLYIWASYCGLSRMETQRLAKWRHAHADVPIEILTFSIDEDEEAWRKALKDDSLDWTGQLRGQAAWGSPEIQQFEVQSIPVSFVLDAKGIIRSKNANVMDLERDYDAIVRKWGNQ